MIIPQVNPQPSAQPAGKSLQAGALGWTRIAGLGVAIAVSGQFSGWNYGLTAGGWGGLVAAAFCTGLFYLGFTQCVAELAAAMPSAGGFETYCNRAFGTVAGYMVGMSVLVALSIGIGVVADFTAAYAQSLLGIPPWGSKIVLFCGVLILQLRGAREAVGVTMWVGAIAIAVLLLFCASMVPFASPAHLILHGGGEGWFPHGIAGIFAALPYALWLFLAVEQAALAAEEAADPGKSVPKALAVAVLTLLLSGLGVLVFAPAGGGAEQIGGADDPLFAALTSPLAYGHQNWITRLISAGALVGLIATFFSLVYASSRQLYSLSRDCYLPKRLCVTNRRQAPHAALLVVVAVGIVASVFPPERGMLLVIFPLSLSYLMVLGAYLRLRQHEPQMPRPYSAVGGRITACLTTVILLFVLGACLAGEPVGMTYALAVYALLLAYFLLFRRSKLRHIQVNS